MIDGLKPYPAYQKLDLPWVGSIPISWRVERAKWLFRKMDRIVKEGYDVVTCFRDGTVTLRKNRRLRGFTESIKEIGYQGVQRGDLVIHAMDGFAGAIGVSDSDGKCTPVYSVCQPVSDANSYYYAHVVREMARTQWIMALAKGIRERSTDFRFDMFAAQQVPLPPRIEQDAIVRFLDHADRRIRRYIKAKRRLIALLNEQKQAIIHRAVTRGLDPKVRLKPFLTEWLSEVPSHWSRVPIKRLLARVDYGTSDATTETGRVRVLTMGNIQNGEVTDKSAGRLDHVPDDLLLEHHDLLFTRTNGNPDLVGKIGIYRGTRDDQVSFASYLVRFRVKKPNNPQWMHLLLSSSSFWGYAKSFALVNLQTNLNSTRYVQFSIPVPPPKEQAEIVDAVLSQTASLRSVIARNEDEIELLREYRTRLIAEVVTGKLDVREAAARLPDEFAEQETLECVDVLADGDEASDDADLDAVPEEAEA